MYCISGIKLVMAAKNCIIPATPVYPISSGIKLAANSARSILII